MSEFGLGIAHLVFTLPNSAVWLHVVFGPENGTQFRAQPHAPPQHAKQYRGGGLHIGWNSQVAYPFVLPNRSEQLDPAKLSIPTAWRCWLAIFGLCHVPALPPLPCTWSSLPRPELLAFPHRPFPKLTLTLDGRSLIGGVMGNSGGLGSPPGGGATTSPRPSPSPTLPWHKYFFWIPHSSGLLFLFLWLICDLFELQQLWRIGTLWGNCCWCLKILCHAFHMYFSWFLSLCVVVVTLFELV